MKDLMPFFLTRPDWHLLKVSPRTCSGVQFRRNAHLNKIGPRNKSGETVFVCPRQREYLALSMQEILK